MTRRRHHRPVAAGALAVAAFLTACSEGEPTGAGTASTGATSPSSAAPADRKGQTMNITLTINGKTLSGTLENSTAGRDFASLLPLTLTLSDHNGTERVADLPRKLKTTGAPSGITPKAGDIAHYAPWTNLALFYQDFGHSEGLVRLGRLDSGSVKALADLPEGARVTIAAA
jgi:hypothetical protein